MNLLVTMSKKLVLASILTISLVTLFGMAQPPIFAEESRDYKMAEDVKATLTFTFVDGVEIHEFPVFSMTSNFVSNQGTSFEVKGVVDNAPHLHKALDESFTYRLSQVAGGSSLNYDYKYFEVDVDFTRDGKSFQVLNYNNCEIKPIMLKP